MAFYARHRQTHMFLADREVPRSEFMSAKSNGAAPSFKWVRTREEAKGFEDPISAFTGLHFVLQDNDHRGHVMNEDGSFIENYDEALAIKYPRRD